MNPGNSLPATIELCARLRDGRPCLGRIHRSGVPEISNCTACGQRGDGVLYMTKATALKAAIEACVETVEDVFTRWLKAISKNPGRPTTNDVVFYSTIAAADLRQLAEPTGEQE